jgi:hypothetical protein
MQAGYERMSFIWRLIAGGIFAAALFATPFVVLCRWIRVDSVPFICRSLIPDIISGTALILMIVLLLSFWVREVRQKHWGRAMSYLGAAVFVSASMYGLFFFE